MLLEAFTVKQLEMEAGGVWINELIKLWNNALIS